MEEKYGLRVGRRVRLSEEGRQTLYPRKPEKQNRLGICVRLGQCVSVKWDGQKATAEAIATIPALLKAFPNDRRHPLP